jgi:hypothetical protein
MVVVSAQVFIYTMTCDRRVTSNSREILNCKNMINNSTHTISFFGRGKPAAGNPMARSTQYRTSVWATVAKFLTELNSPRTETLLHLARGAKSLTEQPVPFGVLTPLFHQISLKIGTCSSCRGYPLDVRERIVMAGVPLGILRSVPDAPLLIQMDHLKTGEDYEDSMLCMTYP